MKQLVLVGSLAVLGGCGTMDVGTLADSAIAAADAAVADDAAMSPDVGSPADAEPVRADSSAPDSATPDAEPTLDAAIPADARVDAPDAAPDVRVTASPASATLASNGTQQFAQDVTGTADTRVTWSVVGSDCGFITSDGLYTAPTVTEVTTCQVQATSTADGTRTGTAIVTINPPESGHVYFVSPGGVDDPGRGASRAAPWRTIDYASTRVSPGDTVNALPGVYTDTEANGIVVNLRSGGEPGAWVTYRSETPGAAIIDGENDTAIACWAFGVGANYVRVEGFEVRECRGAGFDCDESENQVHDVAIVGNTVHHIGHHEHCELPASCGYSACGIDGAYQRAPASNFTYDRNVFHDIGRTYSDNCPDIVFNHDHGIYLGSYGADISNTVITNNVFYNMKAGWGVQLWGDDGAPVNRNLLIANNTFYGENPGRQGQVLLFHVDGATIRNNIFALPSGPAVLIHQIGCDATLKVDSNLTTADTMFDMTCDAGANQTNTDPGFVDAGVFDFHLAAGSHAIDVGAIDGAPDHDFDRRARPLGPGIDIGAFEFVP